MIWRCDLVPQYEKYKKEINESIERVLKSGRYILSSEVAEFEKEFAKYLGVNYSIAVGNGTDGLTLSLMALGIGKGDEVITTPFTAIPTVSAIIDSGAKPVFVDINPDTFLIDLTKVRDAITSKTKAIIPVHIFGNVVDIPKLREIVGNIRIIEDASQSHGSKIKGIQSGTMGDLGVFSFYPSKNLGAYGDGGMIVTNNKEWADKIRLLRMYGMVDKDNIIINGINSRLDELQAAILRVKLKYLDKMNIVRNEIAERYKKELNAEFFKHQKIPEEVFSNYHVFVSRFKGKREALIKYLEENQIQTNIYYLIPLHLQKANKFLGLKEGDFPQAEKLCKEVIALPLYPEFEKSQQDYVIKYINEFR